MAAVLKFEMPNPVAAFGKIVVDIVAAGVNGADWMVREGKSTSFSEGHWREIHEAKSLDHNSTHNAYCASRGLCTAQLSITASSMLSP